MSMTRNLDELAAEAAALGLPVLHDRKKDRSIKPSKRDFINALAEHSIVQKWGGRDKAPRALINMLCLESPMLCKQYKHEDEKVQKEIWSSPDWILETKFDGNRMLMWYIPGEGVSLYSRNVSVEDYLPVDYSNNVWFNQSRKELEKKLEEKRCPAFGIDCEIICKNPHINTVMGNRGVITESMLQAVSALLSLNEEDSLRIQKQDGCGLTFMAFDVVFFSNKWIMNNPLISRKKVVSSIIPIISKLGVDIQASRYYRNSANKKALFDITLKMGGEGVVAKRIDGVYWPFEARTRSTWIKIKRSVTQSMVEKKMGDTLDGYVSGWEEGSPGTANEGLIGALIFSVNLRKTDGSMEEHQIGKIGAIPEVMRKAISLKDANGKLIGIDFEALRNQTGGTTVASLDGQDISARALRLSHAVLKAWRPDRSPETCVMDEDFLRSQVL